MIKVLIFSILLLPGISAARGFSPSDLFYTGFESSEAFVEFTHWVEYESPLPPGRLQQEDQVERQIAHLFGPLAAARFPAVPKTDHEVQITDMVKTTNNVYRISYTYRGHFAVRYGVDHKLNIYLPNNPDTIYTAGEVDFNYPCTDSHYQGEGDFWYFWNPANYGCPLKIGKDYAFVQARLLRLPNEKVSYPEYARLADSNGDLDISLFFGMDSPSRKPDPRRSDDVNANNFTRTAAALKQLGFTSTERSSNNVYYSEVFEKTYSGLNTVRTIRVKTYFGPTGINENVTAFHQLLKYALEKDAVMIYDGHSGLGGHLDLQSIERNLGTAISFPQDRYQILFFNSCSSYPYYNTQYFERKKTLTDPRGSKNLDVLTNGLSTYFNTIANSNFALLNALDTYAQNGQRTTYQKLAQQIDSENLFGVNGDEDNQ